MGRPHSLYAAHPEALPGLPLAAARRENVKGNAHLDLGED